MIETIELEDHVSGPAHAAAQAVGGTEHAVELLKKGMASLGSSTAGADKLRAAFEHMKGPIDQATEQIHKLQSEASRGVDVNVRVHGGAGGGGLGDLLGGGKGGGIGDLLGGGGEAGGGMAGMAGAAGAAGAAAAIVMKVVGEIVGAIKRAVEFTVDLGMKFGALAIETASFKHESLESLTNLTGSTGEADKLYGRMQAISDITGEAPSAVMGRMKKLIADGFKEDEAARILSDAADIAAVRGEAGADRFQRIIETLKNKGTADKSFMSQVAKMGVDSGEVYNALASRTHQSIEKVKADLKGGKIAAADAIAALETASEKRFGGAAEKQAEGNPLLQFANLKKNAARMLEDIDVSPVAGMLGNINSVLSGGAGAELKGAFKDLFGGIFSGLFGALEGGDAKAKLTDFVHSVAGAVRGAAAVAHAVAPVIQALMRFGMSVAVQGMHLVAFAMETVGGAAEALSGPLQFVASGIDYATGMFNAFCDAVSSVGSSAIAELTSMFETISDALDLPDLLEVGTQMIDGLVTGIENGASSVVDALVSVCESAISAAKSALGIASPSRVFAAMGDFSAEGFARGVAANDAPAAASASMARRSAMAAATSATPAGGGGGQGGGDMHVSFSPVVHVQANDEKGGKEAAAAASEHITKDIRSQFTSWWRDMREAG